MDVATGFEGTGDRPGGDPVWGVAMTVAGASAPGLAARLHRWLSSRSPHARPVVLEGPGGSVQVCLLVEGPDPAHAVGEADRSVRAGFMALGHWGRIVRAEAEVEDGHPSWS